MGYLVSNGRNGRVSYSGTQYMNPEHGTRRLCVRTAEGEDGIVRYGLTTDSSASLYCGLQVRVSGTPARIGRYEPMSTSRTSTATMLKTSLSSTVYAGAGYSGTRRTSSNSGALNRTNLGSGSGTRLETVSVDGEERRATIQYSVSSYASGYYYYYYTTQTSRNTRRFLTQSYTYATSTEHIFFEGEGENNFNI